MKTGYREIAFTSIVLMAVAGAFAFVVQPRARQRQKQAAEIRSMEAAIAGNPNSAEDVQNLASEVDQQQQMIGWLQAKRIGEQEIRKGIDQLLATASGKSLRIDNMLMLDSTRVGNVGIQPVRFRLSGKFDSVYSFILTLQTMPLSQRIDRLNLGLDLKDGELRAEITLAMYFNLYSANPKESEHMELDAPTLAGLQDICRKTSGLLRQCWMDAAGAQQASSATPPASPFRREAVRNTNVSTAVDALKTDNDRLAMLRELEKLQLQSVCDSGEHPTCMIDNRLCHEGEQVDGFTIEQINATGAVVRNGGYRFELKVAG
jgi:Tfp pilus assembly protein PilO